MVRVLWCACHRLSLAGVAPAQVARDALTSPPHCDLPHSHHAWLPVYRSGSAPSTSTPPRLCISILPDSNSRRQDVVSCQLHFSIAPTEPIVGAHFIRMPNATCFSLTVGGTEALYKAGHTLVAMAPPTIECNYTIQPIYTTAYGQTEFGLSTMPVRATSSAGPRTKRTICQYTVSTKCGSYT